MKLPECPQSFENILQKKSLFPDCLIACSCSRSKISSLRPSVDMFASLAASLMTSFCKNDSFNEKLFYL